MCFAFEARPPALPEELQRQPMAGGAAAEMLELESADGTRFSAAFAESVEHVSPGVVILPDGRGLFRFYTEVAERFAHAGHHAIVIDYYGRTAGLGPRGEEFDFMAHVGQTTVEQIQADTAAALATLHERTAVTSAVTVGFCFGGMHSFLAGTTAELDLDAVVGLYGLLDGSGFGIAGPLDRAAEIRSPVLGLFGGSDETIPTEQVRAFDGRLTDARIEHEIKIYPTAPHSFFDSSLEEHAEICGDAWRRILEFLGSVPARMP